LNKTKPNLNIGMETQIIIRISRQRKDELKQLAKANGMTLSQLFRNLISQIN
jgi:hypothetical protein